MTEVFATEENGCLPKEERVLVLAPVSRDAQISCEILSRDGFFCVICANMAEFCASLRDGAGAALLAEEDFFLGRHELLLKWLAEQPAWSDFPFLFLTRSDADSPVTRRAMNLLGNVILLERPPKAAALISAARAALRGRRRQYQTRAHQEMIERALEKAEEGDRAKRGFVANMNHEIRTPMTVILSALELLGQTASVTERQALLEMAQDAGERLLHLIDDILDFSQVETRRMKIRQEPFSFQECLEKAAAPFRSEAQEKGLRMDVKIDPQVPALVCGDPDRLGQVLVHLIGNAVKFTERGDIEIAAEIQGHDLLIRVRDTGAGIAAEHFDSLFRSFSQVDDSLTRRHGGIGLGLAISKGLVEMMGGRMWAQSRERQGSEFSFTVPLTASSTESWVGRAALPDPVFSDLQI